MKQQPKKRLIVSYKNLSPELIEEISKKYPEGFSDHLIKINKNDREFFYAIALETKDTSYLIKVDVEVDVLQDEEAMEDIEITPVKADDPEFDDDEEDEDEEKDDKDEFDDDDDDEDDDGDDDIDDDDLDDDDEDEEEEVKKPANKKKPTTKNKKSR
ncbi:MAG: hypothetical protein A2W91_11460 [Bacteroidetes bacterium GWF2_38_335]|nr:MAG: hypothetical protein A2W91_11460 [Bacteroidetes bacterium GWF2_38_335]OFY81687.1 MAG: hypothetical protein A2281_05585 [Bacteroidetes bacterium RIFOXYA12_FULL_38_20]